MQFVSALIALAVASYAQQPQSVSDGYPESSSTTSWDSQPTSVPGLSCSLPGWSSSYYKYFAYANRAACQDLCYKDQQCESFSAYSAGGSGNCYLYSKPASQVPRTAYSGYAVYDSGCPLGTSPEQCNLPGRGADFGGNLGYYKEFDSVTLSECQSICQLDKICQSFSGPQGQVSGNCYLYKVHSEKVVRSEYKDYFVFDRRCNLDTPPDCNLPGWGPLSGGQFGYYRQIANIKLAACKDLCSKDISCRAFSAPAQGNAGTCYLYSVPADAVYRTAYSGYGVFDLRCNV